MRGIYIHGLSMPRKTGIVSIVLSGDGSALLCEDGAYSEIKAIPVPDHGRLIDADALTTQMERNLWAIEDKAEKKLGFNETLRRGMQYGHAVCVDAVNAAPTIIPASKEGER